MSKYVELENLNLNDIIISKDNKKNGKMSKYITLKYKYDDGTIDNLVIKFKNVSFMTPSNIENTREYLKKVSKKTTVTDREVETARSKLSMCLNDSHKKKILELEEYFDCGKNEKLNKLLKKLKLPTKLEDKENDEIEYDAKYFKLNTKESKWHHNDGKYNPTLKSKMMPNYVKKGNVYDVNGYRGSYTVFDEKNKKVYDEKNVRCVDDIMDYLKIWNKSIVYLCLDRIYKTGDFVGTRCDIHKAIIKISDSSDGVFKQEKSKEEEDFKELGISIDNQGEEESEESDEELNSEHQEEPEEPEESEEKKKKKKRKKKVKKQEEKEKSENEESSDDFTDSD